MARRKAKPKSTVSINFKGVESRRTPPEGDYVASILVAESGEAKTSGNEQIKWDLEISRGEYKGTKLWFNTGLAENQLWALHAWLSALGEEVPEDEVDIDLEELVGKELVVVLSHETWQGKKRARITDFQSLEDYEGDADLDDDDGKGKKKPAAKKGAKDDEDESPASSRPKNLKKLDEDELRELYLEKEIGTKKEAKALDEDELLEALEEFFDEEEAAAKKASTKKPTGKKKPADDEDEEKPKGRGKKKPAPKKKTYDGDDIDEMDEEELQAVIDESDIDVDLDDIKGLKKQVKAVKAALDEAGLLDD